jgi:hypothetical protein
VIVADVIETVPPDVIADEKLSDPEPIAASPSMITVATPPAATVFIRNDAGVPLPVAAALVIELNVSTPAALPGAIGFDKVSVASFPDGSALNVPEVFPVGAPE